MDPFTEKQLIESLNLISGTLMGIKAELADLNVAVREMNEIAFDSKLSNDEEEDSDEDEVGERKVKSQENERVLGEEEEKTELEDADEGFVVAEEDCIVASSKLVPGDSDIDDEKEENIGDNF